MIGLNSTAIAMPDTPEWYAARHRSIGASEAAAVCGLSRYESPMTIYLRKTGVMPEKLDNPAMRMGRRLEPVIREEWSLLTHQEVQYPVPMLVHPFHECITATPDGLISETEGLECKSTNSYAAADLGEDGTDQIHPEWIIQAQQQMAVAQLERIHFAVLVDGRQLRTFVVNRNETLIDSIISLDLEMWARIEAKEPPDWDFDNPSTPDEVKAMFTQFTGERIEMSEHAGLLWNYYEQFGEEIKAIEAKRDAVKAELLAEIGNADSGVIESLGIELVRSMVAGCHVAYDRQPYITMRKRKLTNVNRSKRSA